MFLKSVKARGFKSFARPVEFALEPGITVVVGPNGSGKSNIADSVTWAMGEQSPSAVRGSSMQDVIFSGSDKLSPAGMAEVELLLDNSNGQIPIEFSEVLISRRLYRDGEGAYFINKSPCRLIDITELLSDAGLGQNTHSIISQGRVDAILESKPVHRRAYIEEAAGLGKYKKRRHRAERKLDAVRRNLERLADVEEEVRSNLRPLKRQATAAERSARLEQQIAEAESRMIKGRLAALTAELALSEDQASQAGARRGELEARLAATAAERRQTEEMLSGSLRRHQELASRFYGLKSRQENLGGRREATARRLEMLEVAARRAGARRENLNGQIARVSAELERAGEERGADHAQLAQVDDELRAQQAELDRVEAELDRRRRAGEEKTRRVGELGALKDRFGHQIEYLSQRQQKLAGMIERAVLEADARRRELAALAEQARGEAERMAEWHDRASRAEAAIKRITARRDEADARREQAALELRRVEEDLKIAKARLTFIGESDRDRAGLPAAAKKLSEENGVKALVSVVEVDPGYERAVSAVLGNILFALAASDFEHAHQMLRTVMAAELGGVEIVLPGEAAGFERIPGEDYLIDHVRIPEEWLPYVAETLASVRVAEDAEDIAAAGGLGASGTWVTRDGVLFSAGRRLLSYQADLPSSVLLKHRNERRQLEQEREAAEAVCAGLKERLHALGPELEEAERERLEAEKALRDVLQERRDAEGNAAATQRQQRVLEQEIELKEASCGHLRAELARLDEELAEAGTRLRETEESLEEMQRAAGGADGEGEESLAAARLSLSQKVTELKITAARVRERQRVADQALERSRPVLGRLEDELRAITFQMEAYLQLAPVCAMLLDRIERIAGVFDGVAGGLEATLKESEELADRHSSSLRELSTAEAELQQELSRASNSSTDCEVQVAKLRDQVADHEARLRKLCERFPEAGLEDAEAAAAEELDAVEEQIERLIRRRELIGPVNPLAQQEYEEMLERQRFLDEQRSDLERSLKELSGLIGELTERIESNFATTFAAVRDHFADVVGTLFPGGEGRLTLTEPVAPAADLEGDGETGGAGDEAEAGAAAEDDWAASRSGDQRGIEISVKPARKALRNLSLLSGGERSLVAIAFLFAIFLARPAPFYILDEVEAALDDVNITRLLNMLRRYQHKTQFIVITHQKRTMECADVLYGVSMGADGTSKVLSRRMDQHGEGDVPGSDHDDAATGAADATEPEAAALAG
ncbi:MAG: chromosome segregation protein SMC [Thermoleophilia bacterium]